LCWQTVEQQFNPALAIALAVSRNPTTDRATFNGQSLNNNFLYQIFVRHLHILI
jgi:hypothetical protein